MRKLPTHLYLFKEMVCDELQPGWIEGGKGQGPHSFCVGIHMKSCQRQEAHPDEPGVTCSDFKRFALHYVCCFAVAFLATITVSRLLDRQTLSRHPAQFLQMLVQSSAVTHHWRYE